MFSEDFDLLPKGLFTELLADCAHGESSFDLLGNLFRQMNSPKPARGGRFKDISYFNGGLFQVIEPIELKQDEAALLHEASTENWSKVAPPIFGTLFQSSMDAEKRHAFGAHFTSEADIQKVVLPTIVRPWRERITRATTLNDLLKLSKELLSFRVLDPACGSGNFLYIAYRELVNLEMEILAKIHESFGVKAKRAVGTASLVSTKQFYGLDIDPFAVELAKVTLMLGKRIALAETHDSFFAAQKELPFEFEEPLPLDNLDDNIRCEDALLSDWPNADAIIGNPPYQSKNKMQSEFSPAYLNKIRTRYPEVPGRADYCVYWFRRAQDELGPGERAGLVGTNTIRQNYSREGGLDYILKHGGTITEAVSSQVWSGEAVVHVSIVNWLNGKQSGKKRLFTQHGDNLDSPWTVDELDTIPAALSAKQDVTTAVRLRTNADSKACAQGQTHGHEGFLLSPEEGEQMLRASAKNAQVIFPFLIADELLGTYPPKPQRFVIDFHPRDLFAAKGFEAPFQHVQHCVLPTRKAAAREEEERNSEVLAEQPKARVNHHHANFLKRWWLLSYPRGELMQQLATIPRYITCSRVTKRPIFEFTSSAVHPNDAIMVFPLPDDYSFGILQSDLHWEWFKARCSTLKGDFRYTSDTVFDTFPWPQKPTVAATRAVAKAGRNLRQLRRKVMESQQMSFRDLYRTLELPGTNPVKQAQSALDDAVRSAYGMRKGTDPLAFLLTLNHELADREASLQTVVGPGLPRSVKNAAEFVTDDCITP